MPKSLKKFDVAEYQYVTPTVKSDDPRMKRAIDGSLGLYEACYVMALGFERRDVAEFDAPPHPAHVLSGLTNTAAALNQWGGHWVLGGGLAMNYHGRERASRDVDFWLVGKSDQLPAILNELYRHDVRRHPIDQSKFVAPDGEFWWVPLQYGFPDAVPVDVDLLVAQNEFMAFMYATGIESSINGIRVRVIGREALLVLRLRAFRIQDRADLQDLLFARRPFDRELVLAWLQKFKIEHRLAEIEALANENGGRRMG